MSNPKDRIASRKVDLSLVPPASLIHEARAMANGAEKYGPFNWRGADSGVNARVYVAAALRHLLEWLDGEETSSDTNPPVHHLAHAKACCGILLDAMEVGCLNDDRPPKGKAGAMLDPTSEWQGAEWPAAEAAALQAAADDHERHLNARMMWRRETISREEVERRYPTPRDQTCMYCHVAFTVEEYARHFCQHAIGVTACVYCDIIFKSFAAFESHVMRCHPNDPKAKEIAAGIHSQDVSEVQKAVIRRYITAHTPPPAISSEHDAVAEALDAKAGAPPTGPRMWSK